MTKTKLNIFLSRILPTAVFLLLCVLLINKVDGLGFQFTELSVSFSTSHTLLFLLAVLLLIPNWSLEVMKWRIMVSENQILSFKEGLKSVLWGITAGLLTPARLGELGGRVLIANKGNKKSFLKHSIVNSVIQTTITLIFGMIAAFYFLVSDEYTIVPYLQIEWNPIKLVFLGIVFLLLIISVSVVLIKKRQLDLHYFFKAKMTFKIFTLSTLRYVIFTLQYCLLMEAFGSNMSFKIVYLLCSLIFMLNALIPLGMITGLFVRTGLSIYLFNTIGGVGEIAALATFTLWTINLFVPGIVGALMLPRFGIPKLTS